MLLGATTYLNIFFGATGLVRVWVGVRSSMAESLGWWVPDAFGRFGCVRQAGFS